MKKRILAAFLTMCLLLASSVPTFAASKIEDSFGYRTETLVKTDLVNKVSNIKATLTVPNYLGTISATLNTSEGMGDFEVAVVYVPDVKWDDNCYYSGITASIKKGISDIYPANDYLIQWNEYFSYGFLPVSGGIYILDNNSMQMNFLNGPGLYTAIASFYYSPNAMGLSSETEVAQAFGFENAEDALGQIPDYLSMTAIGYPFILVLDDETINYYLKNGKLNIYSSYEWPGLDTLLKEHQYNITEAKVEQGLANLKKRRNYVRGLFTDIEITRSMWYDQYAQKVYELGLMEGSGTEFKPDANLTLAQAIAMASRLHDIYIGGSGDFTENASSWYSVYVKYALSEGIISKTDFGANTDPKAYDRYATRAEMAYIFSRALPEEALDEINTIHYIPDVNSATPYDDEIFLLYKAGILDGGSGHRFSPMENITRAQAAAIISRMADKSMRLEFTIK